MREQWAEPEPALWIADRLHDFGVDVGSVIPEGFAAYARLLHPAGRTITEDHDASREEPVSWAEVAAANKRVAHAEMQWPAISSSENASPAVWDSEPRDALPKEHASGLAELLARHTTTPGRVWFAVWAGYGGLTIHGEDPSWQMLTRPRFGDGLRRLRRRRRTVRQSPTFLLPAREYYLFVGPIEAIMESFGQNFWQPANLWWPDDRAWFAASEIDFAWTYLGGSEACIEDVLADDQFEGFPASLDHKTTFDGDTLNR